LSDQLGRDIVFQNGQKKGLTLTARKPIFGA